MLTRDDLVATFPSKSDPNRDPYEVRFRNDDEGHSWFSCNCKGWTTSSKQKGLHPWQRDCAHTLAHKGGSKAQQAQSRVAAREDQRIADYNAQQEYDAFLEKSPSRRKPKKRGRFTAIEL